MPPLLGTYAAVNVTSAAHAGNLAGWVGADVGDLVQCRLPVDLVGAREAAHVGVGEDRAGDHEPVGSGAVGAHAEKAESAAHHKV